MNTRVISALRKEARVNKLIMLGRKLGLLKTPKGGLGKSPALRKLFDNAATLEEFEESKMLLNNYMRNYRKSLSTVNAGLSKIDNQDILTRTALRISDVPDSISGLLKEVRRPGAMRSPYLPSPRITNAIDSVKLKGNIVELLDKSSPKLSMLAEDIYSSIPKNLGLTQLGRRSLFDRLRGSGLIGWLNKLFY